MIISGGGLVFSRGGLVFSGLERLLAALLVARVVGAMVVVVGQARFRSAEGLIPGWKQSPLYVSRRVYNDGLAKIRVHGELD